MQNKLRKSYAYYTTETVRLSFQSTSNYAKRSEV